MSFVVLLSGGLDSTVNLYEAAQRGTVSLALTFDYGQRAARQEIAHASKSCSHLQISHRVIGLPWFKDFTRTSLVNSVADVPKNVSLDEPEATKESARAVWVPNRNGIFLNIGAAWAESLGAHWVIPGFNAEEAQTFPDNSKEYLEAMTKALSYSTATQVKARCFTADLDKRAIVRRGRELNVQFDFIWPCYFGDDGPCGVCESCLRYLRALRGAESESP